MSQAILIVLLCFWLVAAWAMIRMIITALRHDERSFGRLFFGSFVMEPYNRKNRLIFSGALGAMIVIAIVMNILFVTGRWSP